MAKISVGKENTSDIEIHYHDYGKGNPVVLIHGWPLSSRMWEPQIPALLARGHRVIAYDRRGFGNSTQTWGGYDYDTFAADLDALMRHLDLQNATLVGFSMGGGEVARYIAKYGEKRVAKAVFAGAVPPYLYKSKDNPHGPLDDAGIAGFESGVKTDRMTFLENFTRMFFSVGNELKVSEPQRQYARSIASFASPKGTLDCIGAFSRTDFRKDLEKITVPTLVIHGDSDSIVPFEVSGKLTAEAIKGAKLAVIKGAPHGFNVSHAEEFNRHLLEFLG